MYRKMTALTLAGLAMHSSGALASDMFTFNAYGTVGVVHSDNDKGDFVSTVRQPNGAGHTESTSFNPDTKLAAQVQAKFFDQLSAIVQVVSQHQYDGTYTPEVEWANVKYSPIKDLDIRAGRIVLPVFLYSESRNVGYSNPWLRAPLEIYSINTITSNDGADLTYRHKFGRAKNTAQVFFGRAKVKIPGDAAMSAKPNWGLNDTFTIGDVTLRVGYVAQKVDLEGNSFDPIYNGLRNLGAGLSLMGNAAASAQAYSLIDKYSIKNIALKDYTAGINYDPGKWFVMAEGAITTGESIISDAKSWYVTGGYRLNKFTPYATYAYTKADVESEPGVSTAGLSGALLAGATQLNGAINTTITSAAAIQNTSSLGVRWDFHDHAALKLQYDHIDLGTNSRGRFASLQPGFELGGSTNLFSAAVDFVF
jgi:hypothetical protein